METSNGWQISQLTSTDLSETRVENRDFGESSIFQIIPKLGLGREGNQPCKANKPIFSCLSASIGGNKAFAIAVESDVFIFDSKFEKVERHLPFNHSIDFLTCNRSLLVVGLSSSEVVFISSLNFDTLESRCAETEQEAEKVMKMNSDYRFFVNGYIYWRGDVCEVFTINVDGKIYRCQTTVEGNSTLDFTRLEKTNLYDADGTIGGAHTWKVLSGSTMITASFFFGPKYFVLAEKCGGRISLVELTNELDSNEFGCRGVQASDLLKDLGITERGITIKKLVRCEGLVFVLLSTGHLEILFEEFLFPTNALTLPIENGYVHDFEAILSGEEVKLWCIYCPKDSPDQACLGVFSGPSFRPELVVAVPVSPSTQYIKDNVMNISMRFNQQSSYFDEPSLFTIMSSNEIKIFQVLESSTEMTLQRFLSQGKFDLANALAEKYSINMDVVKKARVQAYFKDLLNPKKATSVDKIFQLMISTLETIGDNSFVCTFSICDHDNLLPKIEWVQKVLNIGLKRVHAVDAQCGKRLLLTGKKFYTFQQVMPTGSIQDWRDFCHPDNSMFDVCHRFIQNGQYSYCNCVWTRHGEEFVQNLDLVTLGTVFWALFSQQLKTKDCTTLFTTILDDTLRKCVSPDNNQQEQENKLNGMLDLVKNQICILEKEKNWPQEAVKFVETLMEIFHQEELKYKEMIANERLVEQEWEQVLVLCQKSTILLTYLLQALQELMELRTSHSMRIPFTKFISEDLIEVVNALFDELFSRVEITGFVMKFLKPFAARKQLNLDLLYQKHIESVLRDIPYFTNMSEIPYEERLFCLVELTTSMKMKLQSVLLMVQSWPVPWSTGLDVFVARILEMNNNGSVSHGEDAACERLRQLIALAKKQVPYLCILNKYRLASSKLTSTTGIIMGLKRILWSKKSNCDKDAVELVKHTGKFDEEFVEVFKVQLGRAPSNNLSDDDDFPEELLPADLSKSAMKKLKDRCMASIKSSHISGNLYSQQYLDSQNKKAEMLSHKLNDARAIEFLNLRKLVVSLDDEAILYSNNYPFSALELMLQNLHELPSADILKECSKLSTVSFYPYVDILVAVIIDCLSMSYVPSSIIQKVWDILMEIVAIPSTLRSSFLEDYLFDAVCTLITHNPFSSCEQQVVLEKFLKMLIESFSTSDPRYSKLFADHRIFMSLREREIPLENEFLSIYKVLCGHDSKPLTVLRQELAKIGEDLIKYGEHDLMVTIMNTVLLAYESYKNEASEEHIKRIVAIIDCLSQLKQDLIDTSFSYNESESNPHILNLMKSLCGVGIFVNAFSLRHRNKTILINQLLDIKEFRLASEVALVFEFREKGQWSNILQGFMNNGNAQNLQSLLTNLKRITELWVLPEFTAAWLQVSEKYPSFKNLCPIPLI